MRAGRMLVIDCLFDRLSSRRRHHHRLAPMQKDDIRTRFGARVRQLRTERGWSQEAFADRRACTAPTSGRSSGASRTSQPGQHREARRHPGRLAGRVVLALRRQAAAADLSHDHRPTSMPPSPMPVEAGSVGFRSSTSHHRPTCRHASDDPGVRRTARLPNDRIGSYPG